MELTEQEKQILAQLVKERLDDIHKNEQLANAPAQFFAAEVKYDAFLEDLLNKLQK
ncbi:MAG: hypothetical protein ACOCWQ_00685 [Nanoarchaeota archaeon]